MKSLAESEMPSHSGLSKSNWAYTIFLKRAGALSAKGG
jgi:hypothetical protein